MKEKSAAHSEKLKQDMATRLRRIEGQIRGIARMIEENVYCDEVLHQILSVESAFAGVKKTLFEAHVRSCVVNQIKKGDSGVVEELMTTVGKMLK